MSDTCPVCGQSFDQYLEPGDSTKSPGGIEQFWKVCASEHGTYIHDAGI